MTTTQNMVDYFPPNWIIRSSKLAEITQAESGIIKNNWRLDEIKAGVIVCEHSLHAVPLTLFGRVLPEMTLPGDNSLFLLTAHESCSRLHARIAFDQTGSPWLRDLGSNNGTFVNQKQLPSKATGRYENGTGEGSRGVRLYPGDVIQFGASTRFFILEGPSKYDRGNASVNISNQLSLEGSIIPKGKGSSTTTEAKIDEGVSWGIDMDVIDQEHAIQDEIVDVSLLDSSKIPEKHRKLYDKINEKKYKLANITTEIERIQRKETFTTLSDGQAAQIKKNQNKEQDLLREIQELEMDLITKLKGEHKRDNATSGPGAKKRPRVQDDLDIEEEDSAFYDRTRSNHFKTTLKARSEAEVVVETEQSLRDKWGKLFSLYEKRRRDTERLFKNVQDVEKEIQEFSLKKSCDCSDEDLYFLNNDLTIAKDRWNHAKEAERNIDEELSSVALMLHVIDKDYVCDKSTGFVGKGTVQSVFTSTSTAINEASKDPTMNTFKEELGQERKGNSFSGKNAQIDLGCTETNHNFSIPSENRKRQKPISHQGTLTLLAVHQNKEIKTLNKARQPMDHSVTIDVDKEMINDLRNEWIAPKEQDGTGFTKLNEKYLGRY